MKTSKFAFEIICPLETVKWNFVVSLKNLKFIELLSYLHKQTLNCIFESAHTFRSLNSTISISLLYYHILAPVLYILPARCFIWGCLSSCHAGIGLFSPKRINQVMFVYHICPVNIWEQSEGIERAILPSVGIFPYNKRQIDIKLITKVFPLVFKCNFVFRGQKLKVLPLEWKMPKVSETNWTKNLRAYCPQHPKIKTNIFS